MYPILTGPLTIERIAVPIADLPLPLHGTTLVQLSDFHYDHKSLAPALLRAAIAQCNAIFPDLVLLTGDFITRELTPIDDLAAHLKHLNSRYGTYAVLGNHDTPDLTARLTVTQALQQANISVLWNEIAYPLGASLPLVGLADLRSGECQPSQVFSHLAPTIPRIVLAHNPETMTKLKNLRADLQLSGHTHGGQVWLPGIGPVPAIARHLRALIPAFLRDFVPMLRDDCDRVFSHWEWASGLHAIGANQLYVNRGLGTYWPGRLLCSPELTVLTLVRRP